MLDILGFPDILYTSNEAKHRKVKVKKEILQDLKAIGLTSVVINGKIRKDLAGKPFKGIRAGTFGVFTATNIWSDRNKEVQKYIVEVLLRNLFTKVELTSDTISFQKGKSNIKFILISYDRSPEVSNFWWVLL